MVGSLVSSLVFKWAHQNDSWRWALRVSFIYSGDVILNIASAAIATIEKRIAQVHNVIFSNIGDCEDNLY